MAELIDPTAAPAPRTFLLDADGRLLREVRKAHKVRVQRLGPDGQPTGPPIEAGACTMVLDPPAEPVPCVEPIDLGKPVSITLAWVNPAWLDRVARRR